MQKIRDHTLFLQKKLAKNQTYILGVHKKKMVNFSTQKKYQAAKIFSNQCPGKNFVYLNFHLSH